MTVRIRFKTMTILGERFNYEQDLLISKEI